MAYRRIQSKFSHLIVVIYSLESRACISNYLTKLVYILNNNHSSSMSGNYIKISITFEQMQDSPLTIECYDFNSNGKHDLIG